MDGQQVGTVKETELGMIERHIREGEAALERQRRVLTNPVLGGAIRQQAERLLDLLEKTLELHYQHRDRLLNAGRRKPKPLSQRRLRQ
jgi:hypothetical protein